MLLCCADEVWRLQQSSELFRSSKTQALALLCGWVTQPGFPLVTISLDGTASQQGRFYDWGSQTSQDPFLAASISNMSSTSISNISITSSDTSVINSEISANSSYGGNSSDTVWYVPVSFGQMAADSSEARDSESQWTELSSQNESAVEQSLVNQGSATSIGSGYYR